MVKHSSVAVLLLFSFPEPHFYNVCPPFCLLLRADLIKNNKGGRHLSKCSVLYAIESLVKILPTVFDTLEHLDHVAESL